MPWNLLEGRRAQRGNVLAFVTIALIALLGFAAWSTETGQAWAAKAQLQAAADSAALAGVGELIEPDEEQADPAAAVAAAQSYGAENQSIGVSVTIPSDDIQTGSWDGQSRAFTALPGSSDRDVVRAVRVLARRDDVANGPVPTVLGRIFGIDGIPVTADATAYLGWAGLMPPGTALFPVAVDCCAISGTSCDQNYCKYIDANQPPNPCTLSAKTDFPGKVVSCFEFQNTDNQNVCWTNLSSTDSGIGSSEVNQILQSGNAKPVGMDPIYVDNGAKNTLLQTIFERFWGKGYWKGKPAGQDANGNGTLDHWIVALPIVECQNPGSHCSGTELMDVVGVACIDIMEITPGSNKVIKGEYICPGDPRYEGSGCDVGFGPGGDIPGIDAKYAVLVQ